MFPPATPVEFAATTGDTLIVSGQGVLKGWALVETTGAAVAACVIRDGLSTAGKVIATVNLAANESTREWFSEAGIQFLNGVFVDVTAGTISGSLWIIPKELVPGPAGWEAVPVGPATLGYPRRAPTG